MLLEEKLKTHRLLLASQSPRRRELLTGCGLHYTLAEKFPCEETFPQGMKAEDVPQYLSLIKSKAYPRELESTDILLTADTVVISQGEVLGKPSSKEDAQRMLRQLSNDTHTVITGVTLRSREKTHSFKAESRVRFRQLSEEEIEHYIDTYRPYDKAGAYGIQEWIGYVAIEGIEGSFYNVMGLPIQKVYQELNQFIEP